MDKLTIPLVDILFKQNLSMMSQSGVMALVSPLNIKYAILLTGCSEIPLFGRK